MHCNAFEIGSKRIDQNLEPEFDYISSRVTKPMLLNLTITNLAIIDRLDVQFDEGFNVLTGETGAGKSIILDAFGLLLGDRARPDLVRSGSDEATVEALFDLNGYDDIRRYFIESGFPVDDELVLRRVVQGGGRSRAYINGNLATLGQLQPLA
jgi:DNA repair protein RecN (Recombination protein N)